MFEFRIEEEADQDRQPGYVVRRLRQLLDIATRLQKAGWPTWLTLTGLAFEPSDGEEDLAERLAEMGIKEECSPFTSRTPAEIHEASEKLFHRVWYERTLILLNRSKNDPEKEFKTHPVMLANMQRIEQAGLQEELPVASDFDWGMVNGKLSAVRWVLGEEWDMLDT